MTRNSELDRKIAAEQRAEIQEFVKLAKTRPNDFGYHGDLDLFNTWTLGQVLEHRDSGLLDQSNSAMIQKALEEHPEFEGQWAITHCGHWAVGWVDHLSYKVIETRRAVLHTTVYTIAPVAQFIKSLYDQLDDYPILDEEDYSEREYEATWENLESAANWFVRKNDLDVPEDYLDRVWVWLDNNDPSALESADDQGGYPDDNQLTAAFVALGWMTED